VTSLQKPIGNEAAAIHRSLIWRRVIPTGESPDIHSLDHAKNSASQKIELE